MIKQFTGGEEITARPLYGQLFSFRPTAKIWIQTNHKPEIRGRDGAIWRRVVLIPFAYRVDPASRDSRLADKLRGELAGILNWACDGCRMYREGGLAVPERVRFAVEEYRDENDILGEFLSECCVEDAGSSVRGSEIRQRYVDWCKENGEDVKSMHWLSQMLSSRYERKKDRTGVIIYKGLGLSTDK